MSVTAASSTATFSADELIVESNDGKQYRLGAFSKTIDLATTGAGGIDAAPAPVTGYVALYVIYDPATSTAALIATDATAAAAPEIYGGSSMPAGYTASALVSVWSVAASKFKVGVQRGRRVTTAPISLLNTSSPATTITALSTLSGAPLNAREIMLYEVVTQSTPGVGISLYTYPDTSGVQSGTCNATASQGITTSVVNFSVYVSNPGNIYYKMLNTNPGQSVINSLGYEI
ncbi:phage tail protein [Escherichia coli]|nr:phage tail protein [Escherichia coli]EFI9521190.1 phage tail protein [Escherichia coli]